MASVSALRPLDGPTICYHLKRNRLTQRAAAVRAGISDGRLSEAVRGRYRLTTEEIERLAGVLGVASSSLFQSPGCTGREDAARARNPSTFCPSDSRAGTAVHDDHSNGGAAGRENPEGGAAPFQVADG